ncbi:MAG: UDP-3-O-acyl-N-acetylglucosamine deacetylase [Gammaproteobacteria bacterium]|nr:UDP-3-O-acyl-N-acetylglucosamine deacetylase [Gammaproteobacteria bacterium]
MYQQQTLKQSIRAVGVGLHSGRKVLMTLRPASANTGIVFHRTDLDEPVDLLARAEAVGSTQLGTTLGSDEAGVAAIEHLMSAFAGLGIDNAYVDVDGPEIPIMDGSSAPFVFLIQSAGVRTQKAAKKFIRVKRTVRVEEDDKWAEFKPYNGFRVNFTIDFDHPYLKQTNQNTVFDFSTTAYLKEISRARTFGFIKDLEMMRAKNLALGGSFDNAIVLDDYRVLNNDGLRYQDEFVRHKVLDAIGDLYLLGHAVIGEFCGYKSGHALNNRLLMALLEQSGAYEETTLSEKDVSSASTLAIGYPATVGS